MDSKGVCASCITFSVDKIVKSLGTMKPTWLDEHDFVEEFIHSVKKFNVRRNGVYDTIIDLEMKKFANRKILYWAAKSKSYNDVFVKDAKSAYGNFTNYGVAKFDENGKARVYVKFPQIYSTIQKGGSKPQTFHPHLHFVVANKDESGWLQQIYTKILIKTIGLKEMVRNVNTGMYFLLNTLPSEYYSQDHIPNSFNLHYKQIKKMSVVELQEWFNVVLQRHYPDLMKIINKKKLEIYEIPIICYCAHKECNASHLAMEELAKKGFVNVSIYEGGMKEYNSVAIN